MTTPDNPMFLTPAAAGQVLREHFKGDKPLINADYELLGDLLAKGSRFKNLGILVEEYRKLSDDDNREYLLTGFVTEANVIDSIAQSGRFLPPYSPRENLALREKIDRDKKVFARIVKRFSNID